MTSEQAERLNLKPRSQLSPMLERCCLRVSAYLSFARAAEDIALLTGMTVSMKTQHRLQQRQEFAEPKVAAEAPASEAAIDGGNVRLVAAPGQAPKWRQYKAVHLSRESELNVAMVVS